MELNVKFNIDLIRGGNISLLYHYYLFLSYAMKNGMSLEGYKFTDSQKNRQLPEFKRRGWISSDLKMEQYDLINGCGKNYVSMDEEYLESKKKFSAFILASVEAYALDVKNDINEGLFRVYDKDCDEYVQKKWTDDGLKSFNKTTVEVRDGVRFITGRVSNRELSKILNITERTIKNWRRYSKEYNLNKYDLSLVDLDDCEDVASYKLDSRSGYFKGTDGRKLSYDHLITTRIQITNGNKESKKAKRRHSVQIQRPLPLLSYERRVSGLYSGRYGNSSSTPRRRNRGRSREVYRQVNWRRRAEEAKAKSYGTEERGVASVGEVCSRE